MDSLNVINKVSLIDILNQGIVDHEDHEPQILTTSLYYDIDQLNNIMNTKKQMFTILSLNCQSINAKFEQLQIYIESLKDKNNYFSAICLQETWLHDESVLSLLEITDYNLISQSFRCTTHGGLAIYLHKNYNHKNIQIAQYSDVWESQFLEISGETLKGKLTLGNIYRPPRDNLQNYNTFINEFSNVLQQLQRSSNEVIIAGDFNIDLLNIQHKPVFQEYYDMITSHSFFPKIVFPTRLNQTNGTLIDNFLSKLSYRFSKTTAGILTADISDHLPIFLSLDYLSPVKSVQKYIEITKIASDYENKLKEDLNNIPDYLFTSNNPNTNYTNLEKIIVEAKNKYITKKLVKYDKHKHKKNNWITEGLMKSIKFRDKMYTQLKQTVVHTPEHDTLKLNLSTYNRIIKRSIRLLKSKYYKNKFEKYKNDSKNTWNVIKDIINKKNKTKYTLNH